MAELIRGYAAKFNSPTVIVGEFREQLAPGCFARTLQQRPDVVMILDHDYGRVLGRVSAGTLTLREDRIGLWFELQADPSTPSGQEAIGTVRRGDVKGCSFGFRVTKERWDDGGSRLPLRTILDVDLYEVTLTAIPAYEDTSATLRSGETGAKMAHLVAKAEAGMRARGIAV